MKEEDFELSEAVKHGDWDKARHLAAIKVAEMMEKTDSPREVKALSISLVKLIDECEAGNVVGGEPSPIDVILAQANEQAREYEMARRTIENIVEDAE